MTAYEIVMPRLGLTMTQGLIADWHVEDGAWIEKGALLFTLESEKSTLDIEAPTSGVVRILRPAGETVPVQTVIARIEQEGERASGRKGEKAGERKGEKAGEREGESAPKSTIESPTSGISPKARRLAREWGVDVAALTGSGPRGMVVAADVERAAQAAPQKALLRATPVARRVAEQLGVDLRAVKGSGPQGRITRADVEQATATPAAPALAPAPAPALPLAGLRALIAERLTRGWNERPQVTLVCEVDASELVSLRRQLHEELGVKLSYNTFIIKAVALALREHPHVNVQLTETGLRQLETIHVGLAVDTERGLLVPVLRDADRRPLAALDRELRALAERALAGRSLPDEFSGGSITVTNLGAYDIDAFTPIINPPESAILGVGRIAPKPVVFQGQIVARERVTLSLSFDHRLLDGAPAARFLQRIKQRLERPVGLVIANGE